MSNSWFSPEVKSAIGLGATMALAQRFGLVSSITGPVADATYSFLGSWAGDIGALAAYGLIGYVYLNYIDPEVKKW
jgi:hypothetical protein